MSVLALDVAGVPSSWISYDDAISHHAKNQVVWSLGETVAKYHGGTQKNGQQSYLETTSIIAVNGHGLDMSKRGRVPLTNSALFKRDCYVCGYCAGKFSRHELSRDHIIPRSRGGEDTWLNCVASCYSCNQRKGNKSLKECGMSLVYVPYTPNRFEYLILQNRRILADQMEYLMSGVPNHSRLWN